MLQTGIRNKGMTQPQLSQPFRLSQKLHAKVTDLGGLQVQFFKVGQSLKVPELRFRHGNRRQREGLNLTSHLSDSPANRPHPFGYRLIASSYGWLDGRRWQARSR